MLKELRREIQYLATAEKAKNAAWFFKTGKGEYGEGDIFIGLSVPQSRLIAKKFKNLSRSETLELLHSKLHEERLIALFILIHQFNSGGEDLQKEIYELYLDNSKYVNNWDLVDSSADKIVGAYIYERHRNILHKLALSEMLWEKRIAIIATAYFIKRGEYKDTFEVAELLINDRHDLIHKAVGWMLREVGEKVSIQKEKEFLLKYYKKMPRTMLRYAIEKFPVEERKRYLLGTI